MPKRCDTTVPKCNFRAQGQYADMGPSPRQAAMALRKAFPNERQHDFWNILLCFLVHQDNSVTQKERNLFGTLAYRMMSKAAESIPTDQVSGRPASWACKAHHYSGERAHVWQSCGHTRGGSTACTDLSCDGSCKRSSGTATRSNFEREVTRRRPRSATYTRPCTRGTARIEAMG